MRLIALFTLLIFTSVCAAVVPPSFPVSSLKPDVVFLGTVRLLSGKVNFNPRTSSDVCSVTYTAEVLEPIVGARAGEIISVNLLDDAPRNLPGFVLGKTYVVYAERRETHQRVELSDGLYGFQRPPFECFGKPSALQAYIEFSGEVVAGGEGKKYVNSPGLRLIEGISDLESAYWADYEVEFGQKSLDEWLQDETPYLGPSLESLMSFLREHFSDVRSDKS